MKAVSETIAFTFEEVIFPVIRLKNNYRKLKFSILLQTVLVTAVTLLVGIFLLNYVILSR